MRRAALYALAWDWTTENSATSTNMQFKVLKGYVLPEQYNPQQISHPENNAIITVH